jgi:membrane protease YdiL (CAAX protease family)
LFLATVLINPVFEEPVETGYFIQSLQRSGPWVAVSASTTLRAFLRAYQGVNALALIFPTGLIFGFA